MHWKPATCAAMALVVFAAPHCLADALTPAMRRDDPRLAVTVRIASPRLRVGDLLQQLAAQTGVAISAEDRDGAGDTAIAAFVEGVPLGEVLDGLWSLLSYRGATYSWQREGPPGAYRYVFVRPLAARSLPQRLAGMSQSMFEGMARALLRAAAAGPDERRQLTQKMVSDLGVDPSTVDGLVGSARLWQGLGTLNECVSPEKLDGILRGTEPGGVLRVPVSELSQAGREFVRSVWAASWGDGTPPGSIEPTYIQFDTQRSPTQVGRSLYIEMEGIGGYGYAGGTPLHDAIQKRVSEMWMLNGDAAHSALDDRVVDTPRDPPPGRAPGKWAVPVHLRLQELHTSGRVPLLARIPGDKLSDPGHPYGLTVGAFRQRLTGVADIMGKWRGRVLLLDYPAWFHDAPAVGTWALVRRLRRSQAASGGFISSTDMADAAALLSAPQLQDLADEFSVLANVAAWRDLLLAACPTRLALNQLRSRDGRALTADTARTLRANPTLAAALDRQPVKALRLVETDIAGHEPVRRETTFGFVGADGEWIPVVGFYQERTAPAKQASPP